MAGQDPDAIMIAGDGDMYVAPPGSTLPTNMAATLDAAFQQVGYITEDGATFRNEDTKEPIRVWQSQYPVKHRKQETVTQLEMVLAQFDSITVPLAFGGGTITQVAEDAGPPLIPQHFRYDPPDPSDIDERACVLDWQYDTYDYRLVIPKVSISGSVEVQLTRVQESQLPITLDVIGTPGVKPYTIYTTDPAFTPAA